MSLGLVDVVVDEFEADLFLGHLLQVQLDLVHDAVDEFGVQQDTVLLLEPLLDLLYVLHVFDGLHLREQFSAELGLHSSRIPIRVREGLEDELVVGGLQFGSFLNFLFHKLVLLLQLLFHVFVTGV